MKIELKVFDHTICGEEVTKYTLINDQGASVGVITYGGIITDIRVPDQNGKLENVVFGHNQISEYETHNLYFGCIVGRVAGRISNASFKLNDQVYTLPKNNNDNCLHGGVKGFDKVIWNATTLVEPTKVSLILHYLSQDGDEGFPGNLDVIVKYSWDNDNRLTINYKATTDQETYITLTNHSYFNLSGDLSSTVLNHFLSIQADEYIEIDNQAIPINIASVSHTPFDLRSMKKIGKDIEKNSTQLKNGMGYDHPFILNSSSSPAAVLYCEESGRKLQVTTDEKCLVCYSGNYLNDQMKIYDDISIQKRGAVCLEAQHYPDQMNFDQVPTISLKPNEIYKTTTSFHFTVDEINI